MDKVDSPRLAVVCGRGLFHSVELDARVVFFWKEFRDIVSGKFVDFK